MNWKRTHDHTHKIPMRHSDGAAGYDLATIEDVSIYPGASVLVHTGWIVQIPEGHVGLIRDRSGMAKIGITTRAGVIDSDYGGEVRVMLRNESDELVNLASGLRVAQLIVVPCLMEDSVEVDDMRETERGANGFGSTGNG